MTCFASSKAHDPAVEGSIYPAIAKRDREDDRTFMVFRRPDMPAFLVVIFEAAA
jgi:hypothetical protein